MLLDYLLRPLHGRLDVAQGPQHDHVLSVDPPDLLLSRRVVQRHLTRVQFFASGFQSSFRCLKLFCVPERHLVRVRAAFVASLILRSLLLQFVSRSLRLRMERNFVLALCWWQIFVENVH